jgi:hypothetical protein
MKVIISIVFVILCFTAIGTAQKMQFYSGFVAGRPIHLMMQQEVDGEVNGYCLDVTRRVRYEIEGIYNSLGHYYEIQCQDPNANFRFLFMRASTAKEGKLEGIYYGLQIRGFFDMQLQQQGNFNGSRTVEMVNGLYPQIYDDLGDVSLHPMVPFQQDLNSGLFYLNENSPIYLPSGLLLEGRKINEFQNVRVKFRDWQLKTEEGTKELQLQYQIITYFPQLIALVVVHEKEQKGNTLQEKFSFLLYQQNTDQSWVNITAEKTVGDDFLSRMQAKTQKAKFSKTKTYFSIETAGEGVLLNLNTPRITLNIPDESLSSAVLSMQWQWTDKGLILK